MKNPTRVKVSLTVDLEEVPLTVASVLRHTSKKLGATSESVMRTSSAVLSDKELDLELIDRLEAARVELMAADLKLQDCYSILANYMKAQLELAVESEEQPVEE